MRENLVKLGLIFSWLPQKAFADAYQGQIINPLGPNCGDFSCVADKIITYMQYIAAPLATIMVIVGGYELLTAGGNPEKASKGKKTLLYAAVGLAVVLLAQGVKTIIQNIFA